MNAVIATHGLLKSFGHVKALDGLDLEVNAGEVHGFLGPNGAGKSTTIRVLLGLVRATGGTATIFGRNPWTDAAALHRRMAYVPGDVSVWPSLSGGETIDLLCRLRGTDPQANRARRQHLLDVFQLDPTKKGRAYSTGNRQKVALVAALAVPADLFIFDEPTTGLDPLMEAVFRQEVTTAAENGATVLLSSHTLSEVEHLCDRVTIIRSGKTVETGSLSDLRHLTRTQIGFGAESVGALTIDELGQRLPAAHDLLLDGGRVTFTVDSDRLPDVLPVLAQLRAAGLTVAPPSLEELFLRHYRADIPERPVSGS
ncbi:ABC transporter [Cryobacterium sp. MLB-32]|uniref:ABC transporter ATP-binding protein n=1 Tax=Cryobacterium sp. MLB-32 TaxID=1529318 RepID=UPI0004E740A5|nr:ABC transporter ATP-binding protein [Cryobacterium sp. MLB-32]KFF59407.1 ABC transporter [Cryobacterium sp. MLB-32]